MRRTDPGETGGSQSPAMIIKSSVKPGGCPGQVSKRVVSSVPVGGCCGLDGADLGVKSEHCHLIANLILSNMGGLS